MGLKKKNSVENTYDLHHIAYFNRGFREDAVNFNLVDEIPGDQNILFIDRIMCFLIKAVCHTLYRSCLIVLFVFYLVFYYSIGFVQKIITRLNGFVSIAFRIPSIEELEENKTIIQNS